mmetsp:Transcript_7948/g.10583  ORF Transcript_7948/g.10583 Transcript_7948/m.10583 type:complete len:229 (+) Transcript_7948:210-896(+)|eukprot:CAMPEP_0117747170 /NCGR_PEP_ID=MMETSP0947-20121206/8353_1 /TAXON_ID=44440 /ORGANISM="Chattonella subsalsa, Strain CCMP2191" /LENGTH=228 /DNA_ID=CAMNT_0005564575 /DNA_START=312 /DNA_END=998 /DNA_ORIENTATION=+
MAEGYGISGHKNNYSSTVRCGNWVEDGIGMDLARNRANPEMDLKTTNRVAYKKPEKQEQIYIPNNVKLQSNLEIRQKNHFGLTYDMLFTHGANEDPTPLEKERFKSLAKDSFLTPDQSIVPTSPPRTKLDGTRVRTAMQIVDARPQTSSVVQFAGTGPTSNRPRTRQLEAKAARDRRAVNAYKTESQAACARAQRVDYKVRGPQPETVQMPTFDRTTAFSGSYTHKFN